MRDYFSGCPQACGFVWGLHCFFFVLFLFSQLSGFCRRCGMQPAPRLGPAGGWVSHRAGGLGHSQGLIVSREGKFSPDQRGWFARSAQSSTAKTG